MSKTEVGFVIPRGSLVCLAEVGQPDRPYSHSPSHWFSGSVSPQRLQNMGAWIANESMRLRFLFQVLFWGDVCEFVLLQGISWWACVFETSVCVCEINSGQFAGVIRKIKVFHDAIE